MEYVSTNNAPGAIGPYSQAVKANGLLFTSGQIAINPETNMVEAKTIEEQTHQVCKNLKAVVEAVRILSRYSIFTQSGDLHLIKAENQ